MKPLLTWEELDACATPEQVAALLRKHKIKGIPGIAWQCPLANATGYAVDGFTRAKRRYDRTVDASRKELLSRAEKLFIKYFDKNYYPDLESESSVVEAAAGDAAATIISYYNSPQKEDML